MSASETAGGTQQPPGMRTSEKDPQHHIKHGLLYLKCKPLAALKISPMQMGRVRGHV